MSYKDGEIRSPETEQSAVGRTNLTIDRVQVFNLRDGLTKKIF